MKGIFYLIDQAAAEPVTDQPVFEIGTLIALNASIHAKYAGKVRG